MAVKNWKPFAVFLFEIFVSQRFAKITSDTSTAPDLSMRCVIHDALNEKIDG